MKTIVLLGFLVLLLLFLSWKTSRENLMGVPIIAGDDIQNIIHNTPTPHSQAVVSRFKKVFGREPAPTPMNRTDGNQNFAELVKILDANKVDTSKPSTNVDNSSNLLLYNVDTQKADPSFVHDDFLLITLAFTGTVYAELSTKVGLDTFKELSVQKINAFVRDQHFRKNFIDRIEEAYQYYFKDTTENVPAPPLPSAPAPAPASPLPSFQPAAASAQPTSWVSDTKSPLGPLFKV
jgi:hypothetical protein